MGMPKTHCKRGHEFTPENTYSRPNGHRSCIQCRRDRTGFSGVGSGQKGQPRSQKTTCINGHSLTLENLYVYPTGHRCCRLCLSNGAFFRKYGVTREYKESLISTQMGKCAVCPTSINLSSCLDHDHSTGKIRGVLCSACNKAEGQILATGLTDLEWAKRMTAYKKRPSPPLVAA